MSVDALKPNKNTGLAVSKTGPTRIFPGGYSTSTNGASFTVKDADGVSYTIPNGTSSLFLPKGATEVTDIRSPLPTSWTSSNLPSSFKRPVAVCETAAGEFYAIDNISNIFKSTNSTDWTQVRTGTAGVSIVSYERFSPTTGTRDVSVIYPSGILPNDVAIAIVSDYSTSVNTPSGYTYMTDVSQAATGNGMKVYGIVLTGTETTFSYSWNTSPGAYFSLFIIRGISTGTLPSVSTSVFTHSSASSSRPYPASIVAPAPGSLGIAVNSFTNTHEVSTLFTKYDSEGFEVSDFFAFAENGTNNEYGYYRLAAKITDDDETFVAPMNEANDVDFSQWRSWVMVIAPSTDVVTNGFTPAAIASNGTKIVATDSIFGKTLVSTNGTTWTVGNIKKTTPTLPTVLWTNATGISSGSNRTYTFPTSPALQAGDLVLLTARNQSDYPPRLLSSGWRGLGSFQHGWGVTDMSDSVYYKVMGSTPDTSISFDLSGTAVVTAVAIRGASADIRFATSNSGSGVPNSPSLTMRAGSVSVAMGAIHSSSYAPNYPTGYTNGTFATGGGTGMIAVKDITADSTEDPSAFLDANGTASNYWIARTFEIKSAESFGEIHDLTWDGTRFIGVGSGVYESADGENWTRIANPAFDKRLTAIAYKNGIYYAGAENGYVLRSTNAVTWTISKPSVNRIRKIVISDVVTVFDAGGGSFFTSDFSTWTQQLADGVKATWFLSASATASVNFTAKPGDVVVAFAVSQGTSTFTIPSGWTTIWNTAASASYQSIAVCQKVMGATPDTSVTFPSAPSNWGAAAIVLSDLKDNAPYFTHPGASSNNNQGVFFNAFSIAQNNTLALTFISSTGGTAYPSGYPMGFHRPLDPMFRFMNNATMVPLSGNYGAFAFHFVPRARSVAGTWSPINTTGTNFVHGTVVLWALKDPKRSAVQDLNPYGIVLNEDGSAVAALGATVTSMPTASTTPVGAGTSFLKGRKVNFLTSSGKQFTAGNEVETAVITSLG